jgi:hypothetical protein
MLSLSPAAVFDEDCRGAARLSVPEPTAVWLRCEDVRGGGMGAPAASGAAGDEFVDGGRGWTRGVFSIELLEAGVEW